MMFADYTIFVVFLFSFRKCYINNQHKFCMREIPYLRNIAYYTQRAQDLIFLKTRQSPGKFPICEKQTNNHRVGITQFPAHTPEKSNRLSATYIYVYTPHRYYNSHLPNHSLIRPLILHYHTLPSRTVNIQSSSSSSSITVIFFSFSFSFGFSSPRDPVVVALSHETRTSYTRESAKSLAKSLGST